MREQGVGAGIPATASLAPTPGVTLVMHVETGARGAGRRRRCCSSHSAGPPRSRPGCRTGSPELSRADSLDHRRPGSIFSATRSHLFLGKRPVRSRGAGCQSSDDQPLVPSRSRRRTSHIVAERARPARSTPSVPIGEPPTAVQKHSGSASLRMRRRRWWSARVAWRRAGPAPLAFEEDVVEPDEPGRVAGSHPDEHLFPCPAAVDPGKLPAPRDSQRVAVERSRCEETETPSATSASCPARDRSPSAEDTGLNRPQPRPDRPVPMTSRPSSSIRSSHSRSSAPAQSPCVGLHRPVVPHKDELLGIVVPELASAAEPMPRDRTPAR